MSSCRATNAKAFADERVQLDRAAGRVMQMAF